MLRKKYVYTAARAELDFLIDFYRDMNNKRGRQIAHKLDDIDQAILDKYLDSFIDLKAKEYSVESIKFKLH